MLLSRNSCFQLYNTGTTNKVINAINIPPKLGIAIGIISRTGSGRTNIIGADVRCRQIRMVAYDARIDDGDADPLAGRAQRISRRSAKHRQAKLPRESLPPPPNAALIVV